MTEPSLVAKLARSTAVHVVVAALAMGAWAAFANHSYGAGRMLTAGAVQGALSGAITLVLKRSLEAMAARMASMAGAIVPPLITCAVVLAVLITAHRLVGTPEIARTIAVPYAVSSLYAWIYSFALYKGRRVRGAA